MTPTIEGIICAHMVTITNPIIAAEFLGHSDVLEKTASGNIS